MPYAEFINRYDRAVIRKIFAAFDIEAVQTSYSVSCKVESRGTVGEVLITGGGKGLKSAG